MKKLMKISGNRGMDIVTESITAGRFLKKKCLRKDLAMLVILAIGTQSFFGFGRIEQSYIHDAAFSVTCDKVKDDYGMGCVNRYEEWRREGITKAEALLSEAKTESVISREAVAETVVTLEPEIDRSVTKLQAEAATEENTIQETVTSSKVEDSIPVADGVAAIPGREPVSEEKENTAASEDIAVSETTEENVADKLLHLEGFSVNEEGVLLSCENPEIVAQDGVIILPSDARCTGIGAGAFDDVAWAEELYIPANITAIAPEALQKLEHLMYIEVDPDNPVYESLEGQLYNKNGELLVSPAGR